VGARVSEVQTFTMPSGDTCVYRDSDHSYWQRHDEKKGTCSGRISGVSTISKNDGDSNKDGLLDWAAKLTCEGLAELDVQGLLHNNWKGDHLHALLREKKLSWRDLRAAKGDIGTASHDILEALAQGATPLLRNGYDHAVMGWWKHRKPEPLLTEQVVYDSDRGFAGRFDLLYRHQEKVVLLDLKTSKWLSNSFAIQLNLYALGMQAAGFEPLPNALSILHVKENGDWDEVDIPLNPAWAHQALATYRAGKEIGAVIRAAKRGPKVAA
jgi:hypothetical protein